MQGANLHGCLEVGGAGKEVGALVATSAELGLDRIGQIAVRARDLDRAVAFYRDILKMPFLFRVPGLAFFDCAGIRLSLSTPEGPDFDHPSSVIYYKVDDLTAAHATLVGRGVQFVDEPHLIATMPDHELWMAFFKDSEGNVLALMSEVREPRPTG